MSSKSHHFLATSSDRVLRFLVESSSRRTGEHLFGNIRVWRSAVLALKRRVLLEALHEFVAILSSYSVSSISYNQQEKSRFIMFSLACLVRNLTFVTFLDDDSSFLGLVTFRLLWLLLLIFALISFHPRFVYSFRLFN